MLLRTACDKRTRKKIQYNTIPLSYVTRNNVALCNMITIRDVLRPYKHDLSRDESCRVLILPVQLELRT
jgi:hypothetical protein